MPLYLYLLLGLARRSLRSRSDLLIENLVLRQQLTVYARRPTRPRLRDEDRVFWSVVSRAWRPWRRGRAELDRAGPTRLSKLQIAGRRDFRAPQPDFASSSEF